MPSRRTLERRVWRAYDQVMAATQAARSDLTSEEIPLGNVAAWLLAGPTEPPSRIVRDVEFHQL